MSWYHKQNVHFDIIYAFKMKFKVRISDLCALTIVIKYNIDQQWLDLEYNT